MQKKHLYSIDMLRGLVALLVCLYHFTEGFLPQEHPLRFIFSRGYLGVEIFFVISGFVIPYTMFKSNYQFRDAGRFMLKRLARIEPPYWLSIALIFFIDYLASFSIHYRDKVIVFDWKDLFYHILHINDFLDKPWLKGIYWSLAIEIQYYLLIALIFPLLIFKNYKISIFVLLLFCLGRWLNWEHTVFYFGCHFVIGILLFNAHIDSIRNKELLIGLLFAFLLTYWCFDIYHLSAVVGGSIFIYFFQYMIKPLVYLGKISYSYYLIHIQVGWSLIDGLTHVYPDGNRILFIGFGILGAILGSALFYWVIEKPSHRLARKLGGNPVN
ncbi:MAG: acyltransferase [Saprospiraceae bacterium]|nr:acyltransferase [Saprospiraceae bacterium]